MSENTADNKPFIAETTRFDSLRESEVFNRIGALALTDESPLTDLESFDVPTTDDELTDKERAEDAFDEQAATLFDASTTAGYHLFSAEGGRLTLNSEPYEHDGAGSGIAQTILSASLVGAVLQLQKFRQSGAAIESLEIQSDDWKILDNAVAELGRVNDRLESEGI